MRFIPKYFTKDAVVRVWTRLLLWLSVGQADTLAGLLRHYWVRLRFRTKGFGPKLWRFVTTFSVLNLLKVCATLVVLLVLGLVAAIYVLSKPGKTITMQQPVSRVVFTDQGWGTSLLSEERQKFYFTPQGTSLSNLRYSWFVNLERAQDELRMADPKNMARLGFLVDDVPTKCNPDRLPVGFASRLSAKLNDRVLDITCSACHTGQLEVTSPSGEHIGIRIDGGEATHNFTSLDGGQFGPSLVSAMLATAINPFKFRRFAQRIVNQNVTLSQEATLYRDFWGVLAPLSEQAFIDISHKLYPVREGYGRLDALGRIANHVFADELDRKKNTYAGNAPVSFPALWDIWKFDWVQYTASVAQPLARNLGETLGVGADLPLFDRYEQPLPLEQRFDSSAVIPNLVQIERGLWALHPPEWPEDILGKIDRPKAEQGHVLFQEHCARCHQPCEMNEQDRAVLVPGKKAGEAQWHVNALPLDVIGTDPTSVLNFVNNRYDLSKTGLTDEQVRNELEVSWKEREHRINAYKTSHSQRPVDMKDFIQTQLAQVNVQAAPLGAGLNYLGIFMRHKYYQENKVSEEEQAVDNGFGALDLPEVKLQYKARPLGGVWATAPYLHNGSVPTLYEMLLPADQRRKKFFVGRREFDKKCIGIVSEPLSENGFWLDTSIKGNWNIGHEFRKGYTGKPANGVIGPELADSERWAIIEYLKILKDDQVPACAYTYTDPVGAAPKS